MSWEKFNVEANAKSLSMKMDNARKANLKGDAFLAYLEGRVKLCRADKLAESGYKVRNPSVYLPVKVKAKKEG